LIVIGLVGSITILAALVNVLNEIFDLVIINLTGTDPSDVVANDPADAEFFRQSIDQFFFTVIYVIIVYMIALSCFKLVDLIPDQIMRWLGTSVAAFGDAEKESAGQLLRTTSMGTTGVGMQMNNASGMMQGMWANHFTG
jgi:hypothetical protein